MRTLQPKDPRASEDQFTMLQRADFFLTSGPGFISMLSSDWSIPEFLLRDAIDPFAIMGCTTLGI